MELLRQIHELPEPGREVMYLRIFGGLSFAEIGQVLGKSENWARVTYYRVKEKLRKEVSE
jgi:RNA polymerase sigma-70 factor (ECF subfamily)